MFLWDKVLLPLLLALAIIIVAGLILYLWGMLVNTFSLLIAQHKLRKTLKKHIRKACNELENAVTQAFTPILDSVSQSKEVEPSRDENGEYVILYDDDGKPEKHYVKDILKETFGEDFAKMYEENHKDDK